MRRIASNAAQHLGRVARSRGVLAAGIAVGLLLATPPAGTAQQPSRPLPVILDTDIGDDIDDTWALAYLLRSPELDLRLVVTDYGDTVYRARVAARLLEVAGRSDVPIGIGLRQAEAGGRQAAWVEDYELGDYPGTVHEDGVQAMIDAILASREPPVVIAIGPAPNLPEALRRAPEIAERARFVGMYGSVRLGYGGSPTPEPEWNVRADPSALRAILEAHWQVTLAPLDTCGLLELEGAHYAAVRDSEDPLAQAVIANYRLWLPHVEWLPDAGDLPDRKSTTLFDVVAVHLAFDETPFEIDEIGLRVTEDGLTVEDPSAPVARCALRWRDMGVLQATVAARLTRESPSPPR
jgi:inosine-uridine nucleoside N-ribohydrolase